MEFAGPSRVGSLGTPGQVPSFLFGTLCLLSLLISGNPQLVVLFGTAARKFDALVLFFSHDHGYGRVYRLWGVGFHETL